MNPLRHPLLHKPRGVTLSEVLVALLVMSIGVISLATLFPISTLRMVQATQLTQSTQLRYNAEALLHADPALLNGAPYWKADQAYAIGDIVIPTVKSTQYYVCTQAGTSGTREPQWRTNNGATTADGTSGSGPEWTSRQCRVYMVDPLGWEERSEEMDGLGVALQPMGADFRNTFGRVAPSTVWPPAWRSALTADSPYRIVRFRGTSPHSANRPLVESTAAAQATRRRRARLAGMLPDSFQFHAESSDLDTAGYLTDGQGRLTGLRLEDSGSALGETINAADLASGKVEARVTIYDTTGKFSEVRQILSIDDSNNQHEINFGDPSTGVVAPLNWQRPPYLVPPATTPVIGRVVIETREQRLSWILACRVSGGTTYASVVCFFKRGFNAADEIIHPAHFASRLPGPDGTMNTLDDIASNNRVVVQFNPAALEPPFLKRGGYVCDAQNNRWYRITSYEEVADAQAAQINLDANFPPAQLDATPGAILTLESPIFEKSGNYRGGNPIGPGGVLLMPGVIDVYPIEPSLPWEEN